MSVAEGNMVYMLLLSGNMEGGPGLPADCSPIVAPLVRLYT